MKSSATLMLFSENYYWPIKRSMDILFSVVGLVLSAPLMLVMWIMIKLTSPGPAIFRQHRLGQFCRLFTIYKFRTMRTGSERGSLSTSHRDERITWVGKIFRPFHFDELPQLWNIIKGDMSLVGPRPHSVHQCEETASYMPRFYDRFQVMPGLTGLAQVNKQHETSRQVQQRSFQWDMKYIATRSLLLDLRILMRTVVVVILRNGV
jgi:lipopolysaccharide/colanic/teichoic acid biosynthesis glycosyltransferase